MPADVLISAPWFDLFGIDCLESASSVMRKYLEVTFRPQVPNNLSKSAYKSLVKGMNSTQGSNMSIGSGRGRVVKVA
jgi:hypothetical protein